MHGSQDISRARYSSGHQSPKATRSSLSVGRESAELRNAIAQFNDALPKIPDVDINKPADIYRRSKQVFFEKMASKFERPLNWVERLSNDIKFATKTRVHFHRLSQTGVGEQMIQTTIARDRRFSAHH